MFSWFLITGRLEISYLCTENFAELLLHIALLPRYDEPVCRRERQDRVRGGGGGDPEVLGGDRRFPDFDQALRRKARVHFLRWPSFRHWTASLRVCVLLCSAVFGWFCCLQARAYFVASSNSTSSYLIFIFLASTFFLMQPHSSWYHQGHCHQICSPNWTLCIPSFRLGLPWPSRRVRN